MSSFTVDKNLVFRQRKGTQDDPFVFVSQQITILNGQAILEESVDSFQGITITQGEITYNSKEINNVKYDEILPDADTFIYDSTHGIVFADASFNNQTLTISYWGNGSYFLNSKRIYTLMDDNGNITQTLGDLVEDGRQAIEVLGGLSQAIENAQTLENTLESDISTGDILHTNLSNDILLGNPLQIALDGSIAIASDSKIALDSSISDSTISKDNLDSSILQGDLLKSGLDLDIINGNLLHIDLDSDIVDGNILKTNLDGLISSGSTVKSNLDLSIDSATVINGTLNGTIETGNTSISELNAISDSFQLIEPYNPSNYYIPLNKVTYLGSTYQCILASTGNLPTNATYFILIAQAGSVISVTSANTDISIATSTTTPVLTLNSGTTANKILKLDANAKIPAVDGSLLTGLTKTQVGLNNVSNINTTTTENINDSLDKRFVSDAEKAAITNNANAIGELAGIGRTAETVKTNADNIITLSNGISNLSEDLNTTNTNVTNLSNTITLHQNEIVHQEEVHGLRATNGKLEYYDGSQWRDSTYVAPRIYGVKIDTTNSNPATALTYTDDAIGFTPATGNNGSFDYGSWADKFPFNQIKPCLLKSDLTVNYYLDPDDYTKKADGTASDITSGSDGEVMVEFPIVYWKFETIGTDLYVRYADTQIDSSYKPLAHMRGTTVKDKCYLSVYMGYSDGTKLHSLSGKTPTATQIIGQFRTLAQANGSGYDQMAYFQLLMLQVLFIVMFKNRDSQTALGRGYVDGNASAINTGGTNTKGMFFGSTNGSLQNKFCGIEDFYGNLRYWIDGFFSDASRNILIGTQNFNDTGSGYTNYGQGATADIGGYISGVQGGTETGFVVKVTAGSTTTFYADSGYLYASRLPYFGGYWAIANGAGAFYLYVSNDASNSIANLGSRLFAL